jgi:hypothetical protein
MSGLGGDGWESLRGESTSFDLHVLNLSTGIAVGFLATILIASLVNKFGNLMFRKGVAKPFYIGRYRLHHRTFLLVFLPLAYVSVTSLVLAGYVQVEWSLLLTGLQGTFILGVACLAIDLTLDYLRGGTARGLLKHEFVYLAIPAFAFSDFLRLAL